jgi:hypothetical protein
MASEARRQRRMSEKQTKKLYNKFMQEELKRIKSIPKHILEKEIEEFKKQQGLPQTPDEQHAQDITNWNGGVELNK